MRSPWLAIRLVPWLALSLAACTRPPVDDIVPPPPASWQLTWQDEFDGPAGTGPDRTKWTYDVGGGGWGNKQLEFDTDRLANAHVDGAGHLLITALREVYGTNQYTSARLRTQGLFEQRYGRFEARLQLPRGRGLWPAFWTLGSNLATAGWPGCGELDIMEQRGREPSVIHGSAHGPGYSGSNPKTASYIGDAALPDAFHDYAIEWWPGEIHWFVDDHHYLAVRAQDLVTGQRWVFDDGPMFIILDLAVGGTFGGTVDDSVFPQSLVVDHIRVYENRSP
jgi:beta-glucanase (GH16 family)